MTVGVFILALVFAGSAAAQSRAIPPAGVRSDTLGLDVGVRPLAEPVGFAVPYPRALTFSTDEGTWMSVDVAPDGRTIVFDLLGDLYALAITGGRARRLTEGPAFDTQPRFAPDGRSVAFVSDRGGADALWLVDADGTHPRRLAPGAHLSPAWSPDGRCLVASKRSSAGSADVMLYCRDSGEPSRTLGTGLGPTFSPDGRYVYFISARGDWAGPLKLTVYDRRDRRMASVAGGLRPAVSPDGKSLVFAVPHEVQSALKIRDLTTGAERWLALGLPPLNAMDPSRDALPGYAFTPDGEALILWTAGKLWRVDVASGRRTLVPFTATVHQALGNPMHVDGTYPDTAVRRARRIRQARLSPDGRRLVFVALDKVWLQELPGGTPRRLTMGSEDEYAPAWSPDGRYVAYATWGSEGGHLYRIAPGVAGSCPERLTPAPAYFDRLAYSLDGRRLLALRGSATERLQAVAPSETDGLELVWLPVAGGEPVGITPVVRPASASFVGRPFTTRDTSRVYLTDAKDGLVAVRWDGSDRRVIAAGPADDLVLSPDGRRLAVLAGETIRVLPAPGLGEPLTLERPTPASREGLTRTLPRQGADELSWTPDGQSLVYAGGSAWYHYAVVRPASAEAEAQPRSEPAATGPEPVRQDVPVPFTRDVARGTIVLRGARLLTMKGHEVLERGDLVITDGRIAAVGANLPVPAGAHIVDVGGKTILPGYVDLWASFQLLPGVHDLQPWEFLAHLAYGVTTVREPGVVGSDALDYADRLEAGELLGPRYLAASVVRSADTAGRTPAPVAIQLQQHGGMNWTRPLALLQDGLPVYLGTIPVTPLGQDVVQLVARSGVTYVPGLVKNDGAPWPLDRLIAEGHYHDDPKLQRFIPHSLLDRETLHRDRWTSDEHYRFRSYAADAARIVAAGGRVAVGSRGAFPGLGMHWELWTLQSGGMPVHDVLRAGTIGGAEALGIAQALGSLEVGKLADLQILDGNPLEDLRRTTALSYVMKGGRLYDAATLAEVWPNPRARPVPWWLTQDPARPMTAPTLSVLARSVRPAASADAAPPRRATLQQSGAGAGAPAGAVTVTPIAQPRPRDPTYALPLAPTRTVRFTTDEGTQMSVDVSPDGRTILFDLLGDLYTVPITGGKAKRLMGGMALDMSPRYSPDGRQIVFVSDRSGQDNLWLAEADGRHPRPLGPLGTDHTSVNMAQVPVWTPDGRFIMSDGIRYDVATGETARLKIPPFWEVAFGGSARYAYYAYKSGQGNLGLYDFTTDRARPLVRSARPVCQPTVSRDDRWLVYYTSADAQTSLRLRDLQSGEETWLARDVHPGRRDGCQYPGFVFLPDGQAIVIAMEGKFWRIAVPSGERTLIPFRADVELDLGPLSQFQYPVPDTFAVRQIREPRLSPDGKRLAFIALDKLYLMAFPHGMPRRATKAMGVVENYPAWSPDGRYVAFSTYSDLEGGHIQRVDAERVLSAGPITRPERLTREPDLYTRLAYTPDGRRLVFGRSPWRDLQQHVERTPRLPVDLFWMEATGGRPQIITRLTEQWQGGDADAGAPPQFLTTAPDRVVVPYADALVSMRWDGSGRRTLLRWPAGGYGNRDWTSIPAQVVLSPDGAYALLTYRSQLYLASLPPDRSDSLLLDLSVSRPAVPVRRISRYGAEFPGWSPDGKRFHFALGRSLFVYERPVGPAAPDDSLPGTRHDINVVVSRDRARGTLAFRGARLITMRGDEVITRGDLVIRDGRIVAVGPSGMVAIPRGARVLDVAGKTILPGYVDVHTHMLGPYSTHKTQLSQYLAYLAYGVTTTRNPSTQTSDFLAYADRVEVGDLLGPRVLGTGPAIGQGRKEPLTSLAEVRDLVRRYSEFYQTQTLKQYQAGSRLVRQWVVMASRELGLSPTTEGFGYLRQLLADILDGYAGHEHSGVSEPLYRDMVLLAAAAGITYDPTLVVNSLSPNTSTGLYHREHPHDDPKLRRFTAHSSLALKRVEDWNAEGRYRHQAVARSAAKIVAAGGHVGIGGHGELHGLGTHWELWLLGSGGLSTLEVLRAGTLTGARAVGLDRELGSLEPGKLADLQVLDGNPLEDLRQTTTLRYVMKDGRLYDAATLDERWPRRRKLGPQWWQLDEPPAEMLRAAR